MALGAGGGEVRAGVEQQIHDLPPERPLRRARAGARQGVVDLAIAAGRIDVRLRPGVGVGAHGVGGLDRRADGLAQAVAHAGPARGRQHQAQQVGEEGAAVVEGGAAAERGVHGVDRVFGGHGELEPAGLVAAFGRQGALQ